MTDYYVASSVDGVELRRQAAEVQRGVSLEIGRATPPMGRFDMMRGHAYVVWDSPTRIAEWPCRLFRVQADDAKPSSTPGQLFTRTYRPVEELPGWRTLGPQGQEVVALIERVGLLSAVDMLALGKVWEPIEPRSTELFHAAFARGTDAVASSGRNGGVMAALAVVDETYLARMNEAGRSGALSANMLAMMPPPDGVIENLVIDPKPVAMRGLAQVMAAVLAVIMRDVIDRDDSERLIEAWRDRILDEPAPPSPRVVPLPGGGPIGWTVLPVE
jgi:hypothetical protein